MARAGPSKENQTRTSFQTKTGVYFKLTNQEIIPSANGEIFMPPRLEKSARASKPALPHDVAETDSAAAEKLVAERRAALADAEAALKKATAARADAAEADDNELDRLDAAIADAEKLRARAVDRLAIAEARLEQALAAEAEARLTAARAELDRAQQAALERCKAAYISAATAALAAIKAVADADVQLSELARAAGEVSSISIEAIMRDTAFSRSEVVEETTENLWVTSASPTIPLPSQPLEKEIVARAGGFALRLPERKYTASRTTPPPGFLAIEQSAFKKRVVREAIRRDDCPFSQSLTLPGLTSSAPSLWTPSRHHDPHRIATAADEALAELQRQIASMDGSGPDPRPLVTTYKPV